MEDNNHERIKTFLEGKNPEERIVNIECGYGDNFVTLYVRDKEGKRHTKTDPFYPFLWATSEVSAKLFEGDRRLIKSKMYSYNIGCKGLRTTNREGETTPRMEKGYRVMFYARSPMPYNKFLMFFGEGGEPVFLEENDPRKAMNRYVTVSPVEQYMIYTGKRLFKSYEDYDDIVRFIFDIETTGLTPKKDRIEQIGMRTNKGSEELINVGDIEEKDKNELFAIIRFLNFIKETDPDIITGHNIENFDNDFIFQTLEKYGTNIQDLSEAIFGEKIYKKTKSSVLKLGGEVEYYKPTIVPGRYVTDSLHAVRRAQAIDSNMKKADLKYVTKYSSLNKENRVYVPGSDISKIWNDTEHEYAFNDDNGNWFKITDAALAKTYKKVIEKKQITFYTEEEIEQAKKEAKSIREKISSKEEYEKQMDRLSQLDIISNGNQFEETTEVCPRYEVLPDGTIKDLSTGETFERTTGNYIVKRYLMDDLYEADKVELRYNQSNFLLGKLLPIPFAKTCTMGTAGIWKMIMLAWSYENDLAIPLNGESRKFTGGLSRLMKVGYVPRVIKLDYNSLYPSILITWAIKNDLDIDDIMLVMLEFILTSREKYKGLKGKAGKEAKKLKKTIESFEGAYEELHKLKMQLQAAESEENANDKKQLPFKIFGNSYFGSFGSPIFPWSNMDAAEKTTCIGRQSFRLMARWFSDRGYVPIVGDTDGCNYALPSEEELAKRTYVGKGLNRETQEGKIYTGYEADVAEFNDLFMRGKMGLGIDEVLVATVNFSRKNYADLFDNGKIKLVGNTIKSKKMPKYIENFLDVAIIELLHGEGQTFLDHYYDYIDKIYNLRIPLRDIASVGKIKTTIEDYKKACQQLTKAGSKKSRQAWYELAIKHDLKVNMGESIYYINTGTKDSHNDIKRVTHYYTMVNGVKTEVTKEVGNLWTKWRKECKEKGMDPYYGYMGKADYAKKTKYSDLFDEDEIIFNCVLLDRDVVESDEDTFCDETFEYNVPMYIKKFNSRVRPLLVCFSKSIRDKILITNPDDRRYFTKEECQMIAGEPDEEKDQDTFEQVMTMEDKEIKFWISIGEIPPFVEDCGMNWDEIVKDYNKRMETLKTKEVALEIEEYNRIIDSMTKDDVEDFMENGKLPTSLLKFIEEDVKTSDFKSKKHGVVIGNIYDIIDKDFDDAENRLTTEE